MLPPRRGGFLCSREAIRRLLRGFGQCSSKRPATRVVPRAAFVGFERVYSGVLTVKGRRKRPARKALTIFFDRSW